MPDSNVIRGLWHGRPVSQTLGPAARFDGVRLLQIGAMVAAFGLILAVTFV